MDLLLEAPAGAVASFQENFELTVMCFGDRRSFQPASPGKRCLVRPARRPPTSAASSRSNRFRFRRCGCHSGHPLPDIRRDDRFVR